ncbi:MAG: hypothetical protein IJD69_01455 [Alphaproteobacteria bacterium]|nr:hypothetical protein [Alphaproteobacteria bacterium]
MKQWIPACAGMTVLKEIKLKHRRHPRDGGEPVYEYKYGIPETVDAGLRRYDGV